MFYTAACYPASAPRNFKTFYKTNVCKQTNKKLSNLCSFDFSANLTQTMILFYNLIHRMVCYVEPSGKFPLKTFRKNFTGEILP